MTSILTLSLLGPLLTVSNIQEDDGPPRLVTPALETIPASLRIAPRWASFRVPDGVRVVYAENSLADVAETLAHHLRFALGVSVPVAPTPAGSGDVVLSIGYLPEDIASEPEAFVIDVAGDHVALMGASPSGIARGSARLVQLLEFDEDGPLFPPVRVEDAPARPDPGTVFDLTGSLDPNERAREIIELAYLFALERVLFEGYEPDDAARRELAAFAASRAMSLEPAAPAGEDDMGAGPSPILVGGPIAALSVTARKLAGVAERRWLSNADIAVDSFDARAAQAIGAARRALRPVVIDGLHAADGTGVFEGKTTITLASVHPGTIRYAFGSSPRVTSSSKAYADPLELVDFGVLWAQLFDGEERIGGPSIVVLEQGRSAVQVTKYGPIPTGAPLDVTRLTPIATFRSPSLGGAHRDAPGERIGYLVVTEGTVRFDGVGPWRVRLRGPAGAELLLRDSTRVTTEDDAPQVIEGAGPCAVRLTSRLGHGQEPPRVTVREVGADDWVVIDELLVDPGSSEDD